METRRIVILSVLFGLLVILAVIFFTSGLGGPHKRGSIPEIDSGEAIVPESEEKLTVTLFFLSEEDDLLHKEEREIIPSAVLEHRAQQVVNELLSGSSGELISPFPPETRLRGLYITQEKIAYVDLTSEIIESQPGGSEAEIDTIFCLVNTLTANFKEIKRVHILVDGGEKESLGGHIDLSRPLLPRNDLIAR